MPTDRLRPLSEIPAELLAGVRWVLTDIDDTLTDNGKLTAEAYSAVWQLHDAGIGVIAVTGRPAGWCDAIARQWPVAGVVGENGALVFHERGGVLERMYHPQVADPAHVRERLEELWRAVEREVPRARIAKDQFARMFDLAIDFAEEAPQLSRSEVQQIYAACTQHGAVAKISSIHVNAWFGDYSKLGMTEVFLREQHNVDIFRESAGVAYLGDSPNDSPMFAAVPLSVGVANVHDFHDQLDPPPRWVSSERGGAGFAGFARAVLAQKSER